MGGIRPPSIPLTLFHRLPRQVTSCRTRETPQKFPWVPGMGWPRTRDLPLILRPHGQGPLEEASRGGKAPTQGSHSPARGNIMPGMSILNDGMPFVLGNLPFLQRPLDSGSPLVTLQSEL
jgi:hypothetical protein